MRRWLRRTIPSMFHRRLLLLSMIVAVLLTALGVQTTRLTVGERHRELRAKAERPLQSVTYIPTVRGRILDRTGAVLAVDEPGWNVEVHYALLTQEWVLDQAETAARLTHGREPWKQMSLAERDAAVMSFVPDYQEQVEQMWQVLADLSGQSREELDGVRGAIVGRTETIAAEVSLRHRQRRMAELREDVSAAEAYTPIREQAQPHAVLFDVDESAVTVLNNLIADAEAEAPNWQRRTPRGVTAIAPPPGNAVWLEVAPVRARHRRYPLETLTLTLDRSTLPGPLGSDTPAEMTVEGVGLHMLGQMRPVYAEDDAWEERPFLNVDETTGETTIDLAGYRAGDRIGAFGIERSMEHALRGSRGRVARHLDTGEIAEQTEPQAGGDVVLTLDHRLQARVQALMSHDERIGLMRVQPWLETPHLPVGTPLHGSAVVLDIPSGEILAAVSVPGITLDQLQNDRDAVFGNFTDEPFLFRPTAYPHEPGSSVKPFVLAAAITEGVFDVDETIDCSQGYLYDHRPNTFQDWIFRQSEGQYRFGVLDGPTAIKVSANTFFGVLGQRLRPHRVHGWLEALGAGRKLGVEVEERAGFLFDPDSRDAVGLANLACIGQGQLTMTPLQVIAAHAALARGGVYLAPTFVRGSERQPIDLGIDPAALRMVKDGMWKSANAAHEGDIVAGTTYALNLGELGRERYFNAPGATVYAKSGSAQTSPTVEKFDDDGDGYVDRRGEVVRAGAHGWTVVLVQPDGASEPTIGIAVCVEHGWSGGKSAAPIANQIIHACQAEGYLPSSSEELSTEATR